MKISRPTKVVISWWFFMLGIHLMVPSKDLFLWWNSLWPLFMVPPMYVMAKNEDKIKKWLKEEK